MPDNNGRFGRYGGRFVPETVMPALLELEENYHKLSRDESFQFELKSLLLKFAGRPTLLYFAENLTRHYGKARIYLKREDLLHTGSHKINNALGQVLLAKYTGKQRIIAETGAGQHGVACATACALMGFSCRVYMGREDMERQSLNVFRMRLLGAEVVPVAAGTGTLKDATTEAIRDWVTNVHDTHYAIGSVVGTHPYPMLVRNLQSVIGEEVKLQLPGAHSPDYLVACIGGGSNAMGLFYPFRDNLEIRKIGVEAGGKGVETGEHAASLTAGRPGMLHGALSYLRQDEDGQIIPAHSVSAGLDYPGVGPEHSYFRDACIAEYAAVSDAEALAAFARLAQLEGIIPALESAHALAYLDTLMPQTRKDETVIVCLSGRGDKDVQQAARLMEGRI